MISLHWLAKTYRSRPSEIVGIEDPWLAYQFDGAVGLAGGFFEEKANEWTGEGKNRRRKHSARAIVAMLERGVALVLTSKDEGNGPAREQTFADPAALLHIPGLVRQE